MRRTHHPDLPIHRIRGSALPRPSSRRAWPLRLFVAALLLACVGLLYLALLLAEIVVGAQQPASRHSIRNPRGSVSPKTVRCSSSRSCPPTLTSSTRCGAAPRA